MAAQFAAVPGEGPSLRGGAREVVRVAGDDVALEQELGNPERVDDVTGGQVTPQPDERGMTKHLNASAHSGNPRPSPAGAGHLHNWPTPLCDAAGGAAEAPSMKERALAADGRAAGGTAAPSGTSLFSIG